MDEEQIAEEFWDLYDKLTDKEFWKWVSTWMEASAVTDIVNEWSIDTMNEARLELIEIIRRRDNGKKQRI